jgi:hypothetical protein
MDHDDGPDDEFVPELAYISNARRIAASVVMLLEHPKMAANKGTGLYVTVFEQAQFILKCIQMTEACKDPAEFDVLLNLICRSADNLVEALSLLSIP